jgi:vancomycin resistance protein VanJ
MHLFVRFIRGVALGSLWLYSSLLLVWFVLHWLYGDSIWWLALTNAFAPWLFVPLPIFIPLAFLDRHPRSWLPLLAPVLLFLLLYGGLFIPSSARAQAADDGALRVMSFNLYNYSVHEKTAQVIIDNDWPDIVALQELTPYMANVIIKLVGDRYPYRVLDTRSDHRGMGVLSRFPLQAIKPTHLFDLASEIQIVNVHTDKTHFTFYNVHPHSTNVLTFRRQLLAMGKIVAKGYADRLSFAQTLVKDIQARGGAVIVAGDFNSTDQSDVYATLTPFLHDAHRTAGWGFGHTFPAYANRWPSIPTPARLVRIDMIFATADFRAVASKVSATHGESDHLPVLATLAPIR